jgi:hypothetical protein
MNSDPISEKGMGFLFGKRRSILRPMEEFSGYESEAGENKRGLWK